MLQLPFGHERDGKAVLKQIPGSCLTLGDLPVGRRCEYDFVAENLEFGQRIAFWTAPCFGPRARKYWESIAVSSRQAAPEKMGIGPVFAIPKLLDRAGLKVEDIGLWEINEAFASQLLYCRDTHGIDPAKLNVDGRGIALGHPFGMGSAGFEITD